jgi:hypothetical protein
MDDALNHRSLEWAVDIIRMCEPIRCVQGGMWFNRNHNFADATFVDYGAADAFAVAAKALSVLVKALEQIAAMDPKGIRADDLGRAARTANEALSALRE